MNKTVITIIILTVLALVVLMLVSFGPLSGLKRTPKPNPESLIPTPSAPPEPAPPAAPPSPVYHTYHNVDVTENHYQVDVLQDWHVTAGSSPGGYNLDFPGGTGSIRLMDVPDNTTLELYLLSQEEPRLKRSVEGYRRLNFEAENINGAPAYELAYDGQTNPMIRTISTYIEGPDQAAVITLSSPASESSKLRQAFKELTISFEWKNP